VSDLIEAKLNTWRENDSIIMCYRCSLDRSDASCELCGAWIAAVIESRMKARQPGWHLICRECVPHVRRKSEMKFQGRFKNSDEARKVFP
jgi:hypothetical protein